MFEKLKKAIKKSKTKIIVIAVLWLVLTIVFVAPMAVSIKDSRIDGSLHLGKVFTGLSDNITNPFDTIGKIFTAEYSEIFLSTWLIVSLIYVIAMVYGLSKVWPKTEYDSIEHGSSDWSENGEQYKILSPKEGILLAEKNYLPLDKIGNTNVLVIGGSGAGKSASFVIPNAYQCLGSYVFTDPKGELFDKTSGYLKSQGYEIKVFNLVNPQNSDGYNPLFHISSELDVDVIANTIVKGQAGSTGGDKSDPFWDDMAEALLKALIYYLKATRPEEEQNLASCAELVRAANNNTGENLLTNLMSELPYDHPARVNYKNIEIASDKTYSSILSSLQSKLGKFDSQAIAELTSTNTIDFRDIGRKKTALYVISSDTHSAYDFLLTIFFSQMIQQLYDDADNCGGKLNVPTYFILDEFANIGKIPDFDKKISTSRSRKISFSVILQNLDQLEAVYKEAHETIMGNCDTHLFLGSNSQKTVEYFSKALGEKTISRDSTSVNRDNKDHKTGTSKSDNVMARALLTPDELRRLDNEICIIYEKGIKPIKAQKYYYFKYPTVKYAEKYPADHNSIEAINRGVWRKYNPYNPYMEDGDRGSLENNEIGSLDDLFEEPLEELQSDNSINNYNENTQIEEESMELPNLEDNNNEEKILSPDIEKELEDKFDELFGNIDNMENESQNSDNSNNG